MAHDGPHSAAAALLEFLADLPLLLPQDKEGVLKLIEGLDPSGFNLIARSGHGISVFRTAACHNNIYRVTGMGEVAAPPKAAFELLTNFSLIPEWDVLFKSGRYLIYAADPAGRCEVAYIHIVYGLPGVSNLVSDRDFVLRAARVCFPNGMCVLTCDSVGPGEAVPGDPGPMPRMIRGQMWSSGYVVVPTSTGCCISVTLQVDPKGWIPTSVINLSLEAIPLNIHHVRAAVARLGADVLESLTDSCRHSEVGCSKAVPRHLLGKLPPESSCAPYAAAAGCGVDGSSAGPTLSASGVQESVGGWGVEWAAASGQLGSSASLASSSAHSCGSEWSCKDECEHEETGGGWFDAVE